MLSPLNPGMSMMGDGAQHKTRRRFVEMGAGTRRLSPHLPYRNRARGTGARVGTGSARVMLRQISDDMRARSAALLLTIENRLDAILKYWLMIAGLASAARIMSAPHSIHVAGVATVGSYMLLVLAPVASTLLALRWFSDGHLQ